MSIGQNISVSRNAVMAVVQAVTTGGVLFLFYRYLLKAIGPEQVGVWAVVLATASTSRISEMGFTGSAVKFTAKYVARGEPNQAAEVVQTTYITIGVLVVCVLAGGYPLILWILGNLVHGGRNRSCSHPPIALLSVWISSVSGVFLPDWKVANLSICAR
jgi:O-antigen/teichoic acid export membrane protein